MRAAIDLTVKNRRGSERAAALLLMAPTALRVEVATPFGLPALVATAGPDDITIFRVLERRAQTARPSPAAVERWLGVALPPMTLIRLLVGNVPASGRPAARSTVESAPSPHLTWTDARGPAPGLGHGGGTARCASSSSAPAGTATASRPTSSGARRGRPRWRSGSRRPTGAPSSTVRYLSAEYVENPPDAFRLTLPADIPVQRLD